MNKTAMHKGYIDCLRIISIIFVIYNHTRIWGFDLYRTTSEKSSYWLSIFAIPICKVAVPIFLMIAGANLLSKQEDFKTLFRKRILRFLVVITLFGTFHFLRYVRGGHIPLSLTKWIKAIYSEPTLPSYWFLYLYLGFLLLLPLLRKMAAGMEKSDFIYLFLLMTIYSISAIIKFFSGIILNNYIFFVIVSSSFFYPIMGYGIEKYSEKKDLKKYVLLLVGAMIVISILGFGYRYFYPNEITTLSDVMQILTPMLSVAVFGIAKCTYRQKRGKFEKVIKAIASTSFGIYLMEDLINRQIEKILVKTQISMYMNDFVVAILYTSAIFITGVVFIYIAKKIPLLKRLL